MSAQPRHWLLTVALAIGLIEVGGLLGYGIAIVVSYYAFGSTGVTGSGSAPWILLVMFAGFAAAIFQIVRVLWHGNASARTPYLLAQAFALVISQTLLNGAETVERVIGWALIGMALVATGAILSPQASRGLNPRR